MEKEKKEWLRKVFEDKNLKLKHFKTLIFIYTQTDFNCYKEIDELEIMNVCNITNKKTFIKILNYFSKNGYIDIKVIDNKYYICLVDIPFEITQKSKIPINLEKIENRETFLIEELFNPFCVWGKIPVQKRIEIVNSYSEEEIKQFLTNRKFYLHYDLFLLTPYWKTIKSIMRQKYNCCQKCGSKSKLHVHHLTYEHHFYEHLFLDDLNMLCKECHEKEHNSHNEQKA